MIRPQTSRQNCLDLFFSDSKLPKEDQKIFILKRIHGVLDYKLVGLTF